MPHHYTLCAIEYESTATGKSLYVDAGTVVNDLPDTAIERLTTRRAVREATTAEILGVGFTPIPKVPENAQTDATKKVRGKRTSVGDDDLDI